MSNENNSNHFSEMIGKMSLKEIVSLEFLRQQVKDMEEFNQVSNLALKVFSKKSQGFMEKICEKEGLSFETAKVSDFAFENLFLYENTLIYKKRKKAVAFLKNRGADFMFDLLSQLGLVNSSNNFRK